MTKKRFVMYEHKDNDYILDSPNTSLDFIEMLGDALSSEEIVDLLNEQEELIKRLKEELFEARKDYIVDTADISDKPYLDEMIEEERKEIYGDVE